MTDAGSVLSKLVRPNILALKPYSCARDIAGRGVLLDANENPFPRYRDGTLLNRYPDPFQSELRASLARFHGISPEWVLAGSGSDEVLDWIFKVFCEPGQDSAVIFEPTYGMYRVMAEIFGVELILNRLGSRFEFIADEFLANPPRNGKVAFLCTPNNPTGNLLDREEILRLANGWPGIVVADEAYFEFATGESLISSVKDCANLIVMRTLSKAFGRAGIRLGYAVANPAIVDLFKNIKAPYNLNSMSLEEGVRAVEASEEMKREREKILTERARLEESLAELDGVRHVYPSDANFILFEVSGASSLCRSLMTDGVVVRDRSSVPGLEDKIRVSVGTPEENDLFLNRLCFHLSAKVR